MQPEGTEDLGAAVTGIPYVGLHVLNRKSSAFCDVPLAHV